MPSGEFPSTKRKQKQYGSKRVCTAPCCDTVLSIYNASDRCAVHKHSEIMAEVQRSSRAKRPKV